MKALPTILLTIISLATTLGQALSPSNIADQSVPMDTLTQNYSSKLDSIQSAFLQESDSLNRAYRGKLGKLDSVETAFQYKLDSLTALQLPSGKVNQVLDSIKQVRAKAIGDANKKLEAIKAKTTGKLKDIDMPPQLREKVSALTAKVENFNLPGHDLDLPSLGLPDNNALAIPDNSKLPSSLSKIGDVEGLKSVTDNVSAVNEVTSEVSEYSQELTQAVQGNLDQVSKLPDAVESKAASLSGLDLQVQPLDEYQSMAGQLQDPEALKEQAVEQVKKVAIDHFAGQEKVLQEAMDKMAKYKLKYASVTSIKDLPKRPPNPMRGKPFIERLRPGIALQVQTKGNDVLVDFNPYIGYRFTGRITAGPGWNQRVAYNTSKNYFNEKATIFGPRIFGEYNLWKGFCPRVEVEAMHTPVPPFLRPSTIDVTTTQWVWGVFTGLKKEYRFIKNVKGTALVMVRLFDPRHKSPYADIINARFGVEFPVKKMVNKKMSR